MIVKKKSEKQSNLTCTLNLGNGTGLVAASIHICDILSQPRAFPPSIANNLRIFLDFWAGRDGEGFPGQIGQISPQITSNMPKTTILDDFRTKSYLSVPTRTNPYYLF